MSLSVDHSVRLLFVLALLPAVVLGSVSANAIVIHDHRGHDPHTHSLALSELDDWRNNLERCHGDYQGDSLPDESPGEESCSVVLVLELPDALPRVRGPSTVAVIARSLIASPLPVAVTPDPVTGSQSLCPRPSFAGPDSRAGTMVAGILLANHALLL